MSGWLLFPEEIILNFEPGENVFNRAKCCFKRHSSGTEYQDLNVLFWTHFNLTRFFISNDNQENSESSWPIARRRNILLKLNLKLKYNTKTFQLAHYSIKPTVKAPFFIWNEFRKTFIVWLGLQMRVTGAEWYFPSGFIPLVILMMTTKYQFWQAEG